MDIVSEVILTQREPGPLTAIRTVVVFHSLRNTFINAAENAGIPENITKLIVGHHRRSMTFGGYSHGVDMRVLQREVKRVSYGKRVDGMVKRRIEELVT